MVVTSKVESGLLADLVKKAQAGHEVLLTQDGKLVARLVPADEKEVSSDASFQVRSIKGHRVLIPVVSQSELADDLFGRQ